MKVMLQYFVLDGESGDTHRWIISEDTTVGEILEMVDNTATIDRETVRIYSVSEWEKEDDPCRQDSTE